MNKPIRHGEVMLVPVSKIPLGETSTHDMYVVGDSDAGHHHVLETSKPFEITEADKELYFRLFEPAKLVHRKSTDRHADLVVPAGLYKRYHDTEYDPFAQIIRDVAD